MYPYTRRSFTLIILIIRRLFLFDYLYIIGRFCLSVTFLLIYGSRSVFMGIHGSRLVIHSSRLVLMVFIGSRLVFHVSRLVVHGFS